MFSLEIKPMQPLSLTDKVSGSITVDSCEGAQLGVVVVPLVQGKGHLREDAPVHLLPLLVPVISRHSKVGIHGWSPSESPEIRLWEDVRYV